MMLALSPVVSHILVSLTARRMVSLDLLHPRNIAVFGVIYSFFRDTTEWTTMEIVESLRISEQY